MTEAEVTIPKDRPLVAMYRERAFNLLVKSSTGAVRGDGHDKRRGRRARVEPIRGFQPEIS
ncbi:hypothetical protein F2Q69_00008817 [Brassica cretica]|uniref:Uncharacterized protein n=1 Tax=Brassica cretica TaxID=69181 RepID=A0A8S9PLD4_BRACR|nr:hypothetical protein F2Q69_00008817 [Brassica cretica]